ncbi:MAG TPA: MBL fold metallo-hydrolase [Burkholderiales bacterium]|nr:MBL fold metallo-hydrolase [Burkholderiales bacterium]
MKRQHCVWLRKASDTVSMIFRKIIHIALLAFLLAPVVSQGQGLKVTLLGTGSPTPAMNRFGPSTLVEAGEQKFVFDAGRGALQRLWQLKVRWQDVEGVFLTHLHSDHLVGLPDLWLTGSFLSPGRKSALRVWGPAGTTQMMAYLERGFGYDIRIRQSDDRLSPEGVAILAEDVNEGFVYDKGGVKITAFEVDHKPVKPAFGYRIDYAGRSVVLSGDTGVSESLIRHAQSVDLLVHEVVSPEALRRAGIPPGRVAQILEGHTTPEQAGEVFSKVKPRLAVYSHIIPPSATEANLIAPMRKAYSGPVELGEDLMVIEIGAKIGIQRRAGSPQ